MLDTMARGELALSRPLGR